MEEYNELTNLMYAIGGQLYDIDRILYDLFDKRFNHDYSSFGYCSSEVDKIKQYEIIKELRKDFSLVELINKAMLQSDYYRLYQFNWLVGNYEDKIKDYKLSYEPVVKSKDIEESFAKRIEELKELNLDSWRKSNDTVLHHHYYWWINNLMTKESYTLWALQYNDTRIFDTFHLENYGNKALSNIILQYILDNNIISNQIDEKQEIEIMSPFNNYGISNGYKITTSSNMGGMWYMIYLTVKELQEIYKSIGSKKARKMNVMTFFGYINSLKDDYDLDEKFYLYFKE